jgi:hypothetical protein
VRPTDLRGILRYVPQFRERTFVVALDGAVVDDENFGNILLDVAVLWSLNVRPVLVHGASAQIQAWPATGAGALHPAGREALLRYVLRPAVAQERVEQRPDGLSTRE